jgi:hypothetical protein
LKPVFVFADPEVHTKGKASSAADKHLNAIGVDDSKIISHNLISVLPVPPGCWVKQAL